MSQDEIGILLQQAIGLDMNSIGTRAIHYAIQRRLERSAAFDQSSYLKLLRSSPAEMKALIEEVVVPETWFFRQEQAFQLMRTYLLEHRRKYPDWVPRLLSIPCSSGEEPFSMAMAILDAGFTVGEFRIDSVDVSETMLNRARKAIYGKGSFRGKKLEFRERYFQESAQGYVLNAPVRDAVTFHHGNILDHAQIQRLGTYDVLFCRNLLIYYNDQDRKRTVALLSRMLREDGLLFVGHAETGIIREELFSAVSHPHAFAFRRCDGNRNESAGALSKSRPRSRSTPKRQPTAPLKRTAVKQAPIRSATATPEPKPAGPEEACNATPSLEQASRLADQGHLQEARSQCEAYLKEGDASAQAWFLLGLISDHQGQPDVARSAFRKALYLEPMHYETLVHFALLLDRMGEKQAAQRLRDRVGRVSGAEKAGAGL